MTLMDAVKEAEADTTAATMAATTTISPRTTGTKVSHRQLLAADRVQASLVPRRLPSRVVPAVATVVVETMNASGWAAIVRAEAAVSSAMPFLFLADVFPLARLLTCLGLPLQDGVKVRGMARTAAVAAEEEVSEASPRIGQAPSI
jgi:hypothetical protein